MGCHTPGLCKAIHLVLEENIIKEGSRSSMYIHFHPPFIIFHCLMYVMIHIIDQQTICIHGEGHAQNVFTVRDA